MALWGGFAPRGFDLQGGGVADGIVAGVDIGTDMGVAMGVAVGMDFLYSIKSGKPRLVIAHKEKKVDTE